MIDIYPFKGFFLFNSVGFMIFFVIICSIYWIVLQKWKNMFLLFASYLFFASWQWKFLSLLLVSTYSNYFCSIKIHNTDKESVRKLYLYLSLLINLLLLCLFKYFNFFSQSFTVFLKMLGLNTSLATINVILPLGISFYTFQALGYTIDVYKKKIKPTRSIVDFSLFIAYFPQLIAGPIERAKSLLPQLQSKKVINMLDVKEGFYLFVYGLFKKTVMADSFVSIVNTFFISNNGAGSLTLIATYTFAIQLYCDFSGYSDMARGISRFFGIELTKNFDMPFFAKSPSEFFKRWNITLSSWILEYVYIPLFFYVSKKKFISTKSRHVKFIFSGAIAGFITMVIFGFWHGAGWNFIIMGVYLFFLIVSFKVIGEVLRMALPVIKNTALKVSATAWIIVVNFTLISYALYMFKLKSFGEVVSLTKLLWSTHIKDIINVNYAYLCIPIIFLFGYELLQYIQNDQLFITKKSFYVQLLFYMLLFFMYIQIGAVLNVEFIYFQF